MRKTTRRKKTMEMARMKLNSRSTCPAEVEASTGIQK